MFPYIFKILKRKDKEKIAEWKRKEDWYYEACPIPFWHFWSWDWESTKVTCYIIIPIFAFFILIIYFADDDTKNDCAIITDTNNQIHQLSGNDAFHSYTKDDGTIKMMENGNVSILTGAEIKEFSADKVDGNYKCNFEGNK